MRKILNQTREASCHPPMKVWGDDDKEELPSLKYTAVSSTSNLKSKKKKKKKRSKDSSFSNKGRGKKELARKSREFIAGCQLFFRATCLCEIHNSKCQRPL